MIDTSAFDAQIAAQDAKIAELRKSLSEIYGRFRDATASWARETYARDVDSAINANPEQVKELGLERLKILKKNVARLDSGADAIVDEELAKVGWGHDPSFAIPEGPSYSSNPFRTYRNSPPEHLEPALRRIRGRAGPALSEAGLARSEWTSTRYPWAYDWSHDMEQAMSSYAGMFDELLKAAGEKRDAELEKAKAEANDLWQQA